MSAIADAAGASVSATAALAAGAYFLGAIPFALLLGFARGIDLRKVGSGNIGATNLSRTAGKRWGILGFLLDFLKGLAPVLLAVALPAPPEGSEGLRVEHAQMACALAAVLGHVFPVYLRFRGGKGVATSFGAIAGLAWIAALAAGIVWGALFLATRTVSIASIAAALAFPAAALIVFWPAPLAVAIPMDALAGAVAALIIVRHRSNVERLLRGEERRF